MSYLDNPVFILGHPKSGTTLLTTLLDSHPQLMVFPEETVFYDVIAPTIKLLNAYKKVGIEKKKAILSKKIFEQTHIRKFFRGKVNDDVGGNYDYSAFPIEKFKNSIPGNVGDRISSKGLLTAVIEAYANAVYPEDRANLFTYWVEKSPIHINFLKKIKKDFPNAKFIFIYRDPRDNYVSYTNKKGNYLNAISFSYYWNRCFKIAERVPDSKILFIKYEDLVTSPVEQIDLITEFLSIEKTDSLYRPTKMGIPWKGNSMFGDKKEGIDASKLNRYKTLILKHDQQLIEALCRQNMQTYEYAPDLEKGWVISANAYAKSLIFISNNFYPKMKRKAVHNGRILKASIFKTTP